VRTPVLILFTLLIAAAANAATVTLLTPSVYEATTPWVTLDIDNRGFTVITSVVANSTLPVLSATNYSGWNTSTTPTSAQWTGGSIEGNVRSALFEYQAKTPLVTGDGIITIEARIDGSPVLLNLTLLNDPTPPAVQLISPVGFVGPQQTNVIINATDTETGVANVTYRFGPCSGTQTTLALLPVNGFFTGIANLSSLVEGDTLCYTINATNNAGESIVQSGTLVVDATAPSVSALAPTGYTSETTTFTLSASDNLAQSLDCAIVLNGTTIATLSAANNTQNSTTVNLAAQTEGPYVWRAICTDGVGLSSEALQNLVLDTQAPAVTTNAPSTLARGQSVPVTATITDTIGLLNVNATFDGSPLALAQNGNQYTVTLSSNDLGAHSIVFTAEDNAGHITVHTATITIVPNHAVSLDLAPTSVNPGGQVTASGTIAADGNSTATSVTIETPSQNITANISAGTFSANFNAPATDGTYTITVRMTEGGHTYTNSTALTVSTGPFVSSSPPITDGSNGYRITRTPTVRSGSSTESETTNSQEETVSGESQPDTTPEPAPYTPIEQSEPRLALTPQATGVFNLHPSIKWLALFLALFALAALGAYAYSKREPPKKEEPGSVNWDNYFDR